jgi:large subunit ribosomal protein L30
MRNNNLRIWREKMSKAFAVVRVRGTTHVKPDIVYALRQIGLTRKNHCTLLIDDESTKGSLQKIKDYVTWGPATEETILMLLEKRGMISYKKRLTEGYVNENSKYPDIKSLAKAISSGEAGITSVKGMKRYFRLNPPKKGFDRAGIKKPHSLGGALGFRGEKINDLVGRMI